MDNKLAKEYKLGQLLEFSLPSIIMMMFVSLYTMVDGFFVSRYVHTDALSAINIIFPLQSAIMGVSIMFATGGCAIVSFNQGEKDMKKASQNFTLINFACLLINFILIAIVFFNLKELAIFLQADEVILPYVMDYFIPLLLLQPLNTLQILYQSFFISAGKPKLGLNLAILGGIVNIVLDYIFILPLDMGIAGAAYATGIGYSIPAIIGIIFFTKNKSGLHYMKFKLNLRVLKNSMINGSSEMVTNLSGSIINLLFNLFMMNFLGSDGVAAITIVLYTQFLMIGLFLGFSMGISPIVSYHHGAGNIKYIKKLIRYSLSFTLVSSIIILILAFTSAPLLSSLFAGDNAHVAKLSEVGLRLFSISFIFSGLNIFASGLFTALSNGFISALLSFSRTFIFTISGIFILSWLFDYNGLFLAVPVAEALCFILSFIMIHRFLKDKALIPFFKK